MKVTVLLAKLTDERLNTVVVLLSLPSENNHAPPDSEPMIMEVPNFQLQSQHPV